MPQRTLRKNHLVGEDGALVEDSVAIRVFQSAHGVRKLRFKVFAREIQPGVLGNVQPPPVVEAGHEWMADEWRRGRQ